MFRSERHALSSSDSAYERHTRYVHSKRCCAPHSCARNDGDVPLTYTNEVNTGEMCNLWGASLGITPLNCVLF